MPSVADDSLEISIDDDSRDGENEDSENTFCHKEAHVDNNMVLHICRL